MKLFIINHISYYYSYLSYFLLLSIFIKLFIIHTCQIIYYYPYLSNYLLLSTFIIFFIIIYIYQIIYDY
jgi:hypothetical protein